MINFFQNLLNSPRPIKIIVIVINDLLLLFLALFIVLFFLNTNNIFLIQNFYIFTIHGLIYLPLFIYFKFYRNLIRFSLFEFQNFFLQIFTIHFIASFIINILLNYYIEIDVKNYFNFNYIFVLLIFFYFFLIINRILFYQLVSYINNFKKKFNKNIIIYGAGILGFNLLNFLDSKNVFCFIDDDPFKWGANINNLKIFSSDLTNQIIQKNKINKIVIAIGGLSENKKLNIINKINNNIVDIVFLDFDKNQNIKEKNFDYRSIQNNKFKIQIRKNELITDSEILITGAGGSIGSQICLQVLYYKPKKIILYDNSEYNIFKLSQKIEIFIEKYNISGVEIITHIDSIQDSKVLESVFLKHSPSIVMHAAAYKHVSINQQNINSIFRNNVIGTLNLLRLALSYKCKDFLLISTDKAVNPTTVMGATKRIAELLTLGFNNKNSFLKTTVVRFGNVLNSTGSVIPIFEEQIKKGGPITLTDKDVSRYFITIQDAVMLVLESLKISSGGEIFVLKMGKPIKILDIAKKLIVQNGLSLKNTKNPNGDIEIKIIGLKQGEKKYEELFINKKSKLTSHTDILQSNEEIDYIKVSKLIINDIANKEFYDDTFINHLFKKFVENYE